MMGLPGRSARVFVSRSMTILPGGYVSSCSQNTVLETLTLHPGDQSGNPDARMWYAAKYYSRNVVVKHQCKLIGWPASVPFTSISEIRGGIPPLLELQRRWNLPDGDEDKLRFERATPEDIANATQDPESVHPNPTQLEAEKLKAAAARAEKAQAQAAADIVPVYTHHPHDLRFVGLDLTSTQSASDSAGATSVWTRGGGASGSRTGLCGCVSGWRNGGLRARAA